jgi:hypothetical protein
MPLWQRCRWLTTSLRCRPSSSTISRTPVIKGCTRTRLTRAGAYSSPRAPTPRHGDEPSGRGRLEPHRASTRRQPVSPGSHSGPDGRRRRRMARKAGSLGCDYLTKPVSATALLNKLRTVLEKSGRLGLRAHAHRMRRPGPREFPRCGNPSFGMREPSFLLPMRGFLRQMVTSLCPRRL